MESGKRELAAIAGRERDHFLWLTAGMAAAAAFRLLLVVLLARRDAEILGQYSLAVAIATPLVIFSRMRLRSLQASQTHGKYCFGHYASLTLLGSLCSLGIVAAIALGSRQDLGMLGVILLVTAGLIFESGSELCYGQFQQRQQMELIGRSMVLRATFSGIVALWWMGCGFSVYVVLTGICCVGVLTWLGYDLRQLRRILTETDDENVGGAQPNGSIRPIWEHETLWRLSVTAIPLAIGGALASFNLNVPRYFLESTAGLKQLGIFSAIATLMIPGSMVTLAMTQAALPRLARCMLPGRRSEARALALRLLSLSGFIGGAFFVLFATAGDWLVSAVYSSDYAGHSVEICLLAAAAAVTYFGYALVVVIVADQRFRTIALVHAVSLFVVLGGSAAVIGEYSIFGAAAILLTNAVCTTTIMLVIVAYILSERESLSRSSPNVDIRQD